MPHDHLVAPSILAADFADLAGEVASVVAAVPWLHLDVMDGHYVPNLTLGPDTVSAVRARTDRHLDTHLMVDDPRTWGPRFLQAGSDSVTFHLGTDPDPVELVHQLHEQGGQVGVAVRPSERLEDAAELLEHVDLVLVMTVEPGFGGQPFMPGALETVREADAVRTAEGFGWRLEVDGGVDIDSVRGCAAAGADTFVAGSSVFGAADREIAVGALLLAAGSPAADDAASVDAER